MSSRARLPAFLASFLPSRKPQISSQLVDLYAVPIDELDDEFLVRRFDQKRDVSGFRVEGVDVLEFDTVWPCVGLCCTPRIFLGMGKNGDLVRCGLECDLEGGRPKPA